MPLATIFDASSNHGQSIVNAFAADQWDVRAFVTSSDTKFDHPNVSVTCMTSPNDDVIREKLIGAAVCYISHRYDFENENERSNELNEAKMIGLACKQLQTPFVIYNSQLSPNQALGLTSRHCDVKAEIEKELNKLKLPLTCVELPFLYENLYTVYKPEMTGRGVYRLAIPVGDLSLDAISCRDVGPAVLGLTRNVQENVHKTFALAGDKISIKEMAAELGQLTGWQITDRQMTVFEFKELGWPGCGDVGNYFEFITRVDQRFNVYVTRKLYPDVMTFRQWLHAHRNEIMTNIFDYNTNGCAH